MTTACVDVINGNYVVVNYRFKSIFLDKNCFLLIIIDKKNYWFFSVLYTESFQDQCFNSDNTIMNTRWRMLHHLTTLYLTNSRNNHSLLRLADNGCSLKWLCYGTSLILLFLGGFSRNQCHHPIRRQILHDIVFLSQISQISTIVVLYMSSSDGR